MTESFAGIAERKGDAPALIDDHGTTSWRDFDARTNQLIHALRAAGLTVGDTIVMMLGNRRELFEVFSASMHGGWIVVPVNWHWVADEVAYVLDDAGAKALVADTRFADVAAAAASQVGGLLEVIVGAAAPADRPPGFADYEDLLEGQPADEPADQALGAPMFYTSGTTGKPKGVRNSLTAAGAPASLWPVLAQAATGLLDLPADGVTLLCGPGYHSAQWAFSLFPLLNGSAVVTRHHFDPAETLELIDAHGVTNVHFVPTQFLRLLRLPDDRRAAFDGSSLEVVYHGAAPCPPDVKRRMIEWWGPKLVEYYGGTEGAILSTITSEEWLEHPTSVGRPWDTVEVLVLRDDGVPCDVGEAGTLWVRPLLGMDFEYHNDPDKTAGAHREPGVFTLGDVGFLDEDGYLHLSDRKIDMIISGGVNIYPTEIEGVLTAHPAVRDVAVFGVPDEEFGERVHAVVELEADRTPSDDLAEELVAHCREHLAGYKCPRGVDFEANLPRMPTGKLAKRLVRDRYWEGTGRRI